MNKVVSLYKVQRITVRVALVLTPHVAGGAVLAGKQRVVALDNSW